MRGKKTHVEQVQMCERLADAIYEEASRRCVSRTQVCREAIEHYLGLQCEGSAEPARRDSPGRNYGRK